MKIYRSLSDLPPDFGPTVATIGNFDGVHRGHQWVIAEVIARTKAINSTEASSPRIESQHPQRSVISTEHREPRDPRISLSPNHRATHEAKQATSLAITFDPHPARVLRPDTSTLTLITPLREKLSLLAATGIDATLVLPFDLAFSEWTARDFATKVLRDAINVIQVHEGEDFRFGHNAQAGIDGEGGLAALGHELGFEVHTYAPRALRGAPVSSSRIRKLIAAGDVSHARALLGSPFTILGTPAPGRGYGTKYTVPTVNLAPYAELLPANGVYITAITIGERAASGENDTAQTFESVTNIGNRPTFDQPTGIPSLTVESHILNFHPIPLGESTSIRLAFLKYLRPEIKWPNSEALRTQIGLDVAHARRYFALCKLLR